MTIPTLMIYPSVWMQKMFFSIAETERGAKIGEPERWTSGVSHLSIRVVAVAHAALQLLFALISVAPVCLATAVVICLQSASTGFYSENGGMLERLACGVGAAVASLFCPVVASISTAFAVQQLSDTRSFSVCLPIFGHGHLFSFTFPEISDMPESQLLTRSVQQVCDEYLQMGSVSERVDTAPFLQICLSLVEQAAFRWRIFMPEVMLEQMKGDILSYDKPFNLSSEEFISALTHSITRALEEYKEEGADCEVQKSI